MLIIDMKMPRCCDECPMLDDSGDYPMCRITEETRGYNFNTREKRMDRCPIKSKLVQCKDCRFGEKGRIFDSECVWCGTGTHQEAKPMRFYCASGERREE